LFILARLECVGVAAGDVGRIGFGFVCYAQTENADNIIRALDRDNRRLPIAGQYADVCLSAQRFLYSSEV